MNDKINNKSIIIALLFSYLYFIFFFPVLNAGLYIDDMHNSVLEYKLRANDLGLAYYWERQIKHIFDAGRVFPIAKISSEAIFFLFEDPQDYQLVRVIFMCSSVLSCLWLMALIIGSYRKVLLLLLILPGLWLVQNNCDSLTSFGVHMQVNLILTSLTIGCYIISHRSCAQKKIIFSILGSLFYACSLLSYETSVVCFAIISLMVMMNNKIFDCKNFSKLRVMQAIFEIAPYFVITVSYVIFLIFLRSHVDNLYDGVTPTFDSAMILKTFTKQTLSPFPFFTYNIDVLHFEDIIRILPLIIAVFILSFLLARSALEDFSLDGKYRDLLIIAFCLATMPSFILSLIGKYQDWVGDFKGENFLFGYITIYIQYFAVAIFLMVALDFILKSCALEKRVKIFKFCLSVLIAFQMSFVFVYNYKMSYLNNYNLGHDQRVFVEESLQSGIIDGLLTNENQIAPFIELWDKPQVMNYMNHLDNQNIIITNSSNLALVGFFMKNAAIKTNALLLDNNNKFHNSWQNVKNLDVSKNNIILVDAGLNLQDEYVVAAKVNNIKFFKDKQGVIKPLEFELTDLRIFISNKIAASNKLQLINRFSDHKIKEAIANVLYSTLKKTITLTFPKDQIYNIKYYQYLSF